MPRHGFGGGRGAATPSFIVNNKNFFFFFIKKIIYFLTAVYINRRCHSRNIKIKILIIILKWLVTTNPNQKK
jgi:hypothetical protein